MARTLNSLEQDLAYDLGQDSVTVGSTDWNRYLAHLNRGIRDLHTRHNFSYLKQSATFSVALNTASYSATSTFMRPLGSVWLTDTSGAVSEYPIIKAEDKHEKSTSARYAFITGSKYTGFSLNLRPTPTAVEVGTNNAEYWYLKEPLVLTNSADTCEVPDDDALIAYGRMREHIRDDEDIKAADDRDEWENRVNDMIGQDQAGPEGARDYHYQKTMEEVEGYGVIGET
jgi:hypothetical protein